jgi:hypothetical protein
LLTSRFGDFEGRRGDFEDLANCFVGDLDVYGLTWGLMGDFEVLMGLLEALIGLLLLMGLLLL